MPGGRPSPIKDDLVVQTVLEAIAAHHSDTTAAGLVGLDRGTILLWKNTGRDHLEEGIDSEYSRFFSDYKKCKAKAIYDNIEMLKDARPDNWQAAAWMAERSCPAEYGRNGARSSYTITGNTPKEQMDSLVKLTSQGKISVDEAIKMSSMIQASVTVEQMSELALQLQHMQEEMKSLKPQIPQPDNED